MKMTDLPLDERPRERLLAKGPEVLSDSELVAVLIGTGMKGCNVVELARKALASCGSLTLLLSADRKRISEIPGLGAAKYAQLQAVLEMSRRALRETLDRGAALSSPQAVRDYLRLKLQGKQHEVFVAVFLDAQNRVLEVEELFQGTLTQTSVFPREIVKRALYFNAAAVIFAHNHPSGVAEASQADELITHRLRDALALVDIRVLDHLIVGDNSCLSFAERGLL